MVFGRLIIGASFLVFWVIAEEYLNVMEAMIKLEDYDVAVMNNTDENLVRDIYWENKGFYNASYEKTKNQGKIEEKVMYIDGKKFEKTLPQKYKKAEIDFQNERSEDEMVKVEDKAKDQENLLLEKILSTLNEIEVKFKK
ncbi:unnamed protein product [Blepharisma stoltei]|uniref:Uncharacterized protein n=1 Tax=Blepharisma stoltei TaxID=1481888 RepID=A0AAU9K6T9_9CILI|nr:unnamed protein product [Blepharisma stoltei]